MSEETSIKTILPSNIYFYKVIRYNQQGGNIEFYARLFNFDYNLAGDRLAEVRYIAGDGNILTMSGKIESMFISTSTELINDKTIIAKLLLMGL